VAGKVRVSALAKEIGVSSKDVLTKLQELGEYVKSPSSTVEAPVARQLREAFPAVVAPVKAPARKAAPAKVAGPAPAPAPQPEPALSVAAPAAVNGAVSAPIAPAVIEPVAPTAPAPAPVAPAAAPPAEPLAPAAYLDAPAATRPGATPTAPGAPSGAPGGPRPGPRVGNNPFGVGGSSPSTRAPVARPTTPGVTPGPAAMPPRPASARPSGPAGPGGPRPNPGMIPPRPNPGMMPGRAGWLRRSGRRTHWPWRRSSRCAGWRPSDDWRFPGRTRRRRLSPRRWRQLPHRRSGWSRWRWCAGRSGWLRWTSRRRWPRWTWPWRRHRGGIRPPGWPSDPRPQEQEAAPSGIRQHVSALAGGCAGPAR
jgi:hypothetical protein